jgi:hypothetical protein
LIEAGGTDYDAADEAPDNAFIPADALEQGRGRVQRCHVGVHRQPARAGVPGLTTELRVTSGTESINVLRQAGFRAVSPLREHRQYAGFEIVEASGCRVDDLGILNPDPSVRVRRVSADCTPQEAPQVCME